MTWRDRIGLDQEPSEQEKSAPPGWTLLVPGALLGAAVAILFGATGDVVEETTPVPTLQTGVTGAQTSTTAQEPVSESTAPVPVIPGELVIEPFLVVTGEFPQEVLEKWSPDRTEVLVQLPWFAGGLDTEASGSLFAFTGPSATDSGSALYVGRGDGYMALSIHARSWGWHTTEPAALAWIDHSGLEPVVMVSRLGIESIGDRGEFLEVTQDTSRLATARPDERVVAFTQVGVVLRGFNETSRLSTARLVDPRGEAGMEIADVGLVAFTADGYGLVTSRMDDDTFEHKIVDPEFGLVVNLGVRQHPTDSAAWSPDSQVVAFVDYREADDVQFHLEMWNREGKQLHDLPLPYRVWDPTWTSGGSHIVVIGTDDLDWHGLLAVDAETGEIVALQAEREGIREVAASR